MTAPLANCDAHIYIDSVYENDHNLLINEFKARKIRFSSCAMTNAAK